MTITKAVPADVPEIFEVLKRSLREADLPLFEKIWNYKPLLRGGSGTEKSNIDVLKGSRY